MQIYLATKTKSDVKKIIIESLIPVNFLHIIFVLCKITDRNSKHVRRFCVIIKI